MSSGAYVSVCEVVAVATAVVGYPTPKPKLMPAQNKHNLTTKSVPPSTTQLADATASSSVVARPPPSTRQGVTQTPWKEIIGLDTFTIENTEKEDYNWFWADYKNDKIARDARRAWWPKPPPPRSQILEQMHLMALDRVHAERASPILNNPKAATVLSRLMGVVGKRNVTPQELEHYHVQSRSARWGHILSQQRNEYKEVPRLMSEHLLRRSIVGIGFTSIVTRGRNLSAQEAWSETGEDATHVQFSSWNVGNLQRHARMDTVNDAFASQFHLACIQEAEAFCVQPQLFDARAIHSVCSRDRSTMINAGGTSFKIILKTYDESEPFCGLIRRTHNVDDPPPSIDFLDAMDMEVVELDRRERRAGKGKGKIK